MKPMQVHSSNSFEINSEHRTTKQKSENKKDKNRHYQHCYSCCCFIITILLIFFSSVYWSCITTPVAILYTETDTIVETHGSTVKVLSYNMFLRMNLASEPGTKNDWKDERLQIFIDTQLDKYDILLLQEVWTPLSSGRKEKLIQEAKKHGYNYYVRSGCNGKPMDAMLLILSKHPLEKNAEHSFAASSGEDKMASKGVLFARAYIHGDKQCVLDMYNTHMQAWDTIENIQTRRDQTKELGAFVNTNTGNKTAIIAGDFNSNGLVKSNYDHIIEDLSESIHVQSLLTAPFNVTWPGSGVYESTAIDYAFVVDTPRTEKKIQVHSAKIKPMFVKNQPFATLSDHYGVSFDIECNIDSSQRESISVVVGSLKK